MLTFLRRVFGFLAFAVALSGASTVAALDRIAVPADGIGAAGDSMGAAVALSGDTFAVGMPQGRVTPSAAPGAIAIFRNVAGAWQREAFLGPGLAPIFALGPDMLVVGGTSVATFVRSGTTWSLYDVLAEAASSVALSGDTLLVSGAPANVYTRNDGAWTLQASLAGDHPDESIVRVALDGDVAAIAGYVMTPRSFYQAYVHFYHRAGTAWTLESTVDGGLVFPGKNDVMIAVSGETVLIDRQAYVRDQGTWSLQGTLDPLVQTAVASIAIDGDRAILGSPSDGIPGLSGAGTVYLFERSGGVWARTDHEADPNATFDAGFGSSVAIEGDTILVGAPNAVTAAGSAGDASVFDVATTPATYVATVDAGDAHARESFGTSFGASGSTLVVAAPDADTIEFLPHGAAYVFELAPEGWTFETELDDPGNAPFGFGASAAASGDEIVVGSPNDDPGGAAYVYTRGDGSWPEAARLASDSAEYSAFGQTVAFDGDRIAVGAPRGHGSVHLFTGSGSSWAEEAALVPSASSDGDAFGSVLSLAGDTILVGAPGAPVGIENAAGRAFVFFNDGSGWAEQAALQSPSPLAGTGFGRAVATRGDLALVSTNYSQSNMQHVYVFRRSGTAWSLEATLDIDSGATEGYVAALAISLDESVIAIGMPTQFPGSGRVLTYVRDGGAWTPSRTLTNDGPGNPGGADGFGAALQFLGEDLLVGAPADGYGGALYTFGFGDPIFASGFDPAP